MIIILTYFLPVYLFGRDRELFNVPNPPLPGSVCGKNNPGLTTHPMNLLGQVINIRSDNIPKLLFSDKLTLNSEVDGIILNQRPEQSNGESFKASVVILPSERYNFHLWENRERVYPAHRPSRRPS